MKKMLTSTQKAYTIKSQSSQKEYFVTLKTGGKLLQSRLFALRKEKGVTQKEIAELLGITKEAYGRKELGHNQFKLSEMFIIARYFNQDIGDIFLPD